MNSIFTLITMTLITYIHVCLNIPTYTTYTGRPTDSPTVCGELLENIVWGVLSVQKDMGFNVFSMLTHDCVTHGKSLEIADTEQSIAQKYH